MINWLTAKAIGFVLGRTGGRLWRTLEQQAADPEATQREVLLDIVRANAESEFGRAHGFGAVDSIDAFRAAVPVNDYESLRPWIERQERDDAPALTVAAPLLYAQTSGTTGAPKYLPVTQPGLDRQAEAQRLLAAMVGRHANTFEGKILGIGSPAVEGHLPSGKPYGSASGLIFDGMPALVRSRYVLDDETIAMTDHDERYRAIVRAALLADDLVAIATANPSTFLRLHEVMERDWDELVGSIARKRPLRGRELEAARVDGGPLFSRLWPRLNTLTAWTGGSCGLAMERVRPLLGDDVKVFELGYSASEFRGSVATGPDRPDSVPLIGHVFFEFVEQHRWEAGEQAFIGVGELEPGHRYYVFVTTIDGLYRYDMNDIVEAVDRFGNTPTIVFVQKGKGVTNITGEKLAESQVIAAMRAAGGGRLPGSGFFLALADAEAQQYRLYVEGPLGTPTAALASAVDVRLAEANIEYGSKRMSGRLQPPVVVELRSGTAGEYRRHCVAAGQRDAQFKVQYLQMADAVDFDLATHSVTGESGGE